MKKSTKFHLSMVICALLSSWACCLSSDLLPSTGDGEANQTLETEVSEKQAFTSPEIGAAAFDRTNGILYIIERLADDYQSVVHVFQIAP